MIDVELPVTRLLDLIGKQSAWRQSQESMVLLLDWRLEDPWLADPFSGLIEAQACLQRGLRPAILLIGQPEISWVREVAPVVLPPGSEAWRVLDWPGLAYLRYAQLPDGLEPALETALTGTSASVPEKVIGDTGLLLRALSDLRHLLIENRQKSLAAKKLDFSKASGSKETVSRFHLTTIPAFDVRGRDKLKRLWALDDMACAISPATGGLKRLREAIDDFERFWDQFEQAKTRIDPVEGEEDESARKSGSIAAQGQIDMISRALSVVEREIDALRTTFQEINSP